MNYICPVCYYNKLTSPAQDDLICPCCGTHFGLDDYAYSNEEIRKAWLKEGSDWCIHQTSRPENWKETTVVPETKLKIVQKTGNKGELLYASKNGMTAIIAYFEPSGIKYDCSESVINIGLQNTLSTTVTSEERRMIESVIDNFRNEPLV